MNYQNAMLTRPYGELDFPFEPRRQPKKPESSLIIT